MPVPERAKGWLNFYKPPELTPHQLGVRFMTLLQIMERDTHIMTHQFMGLRPAPGQTVLDADHLEQLRRKMTMLAVMGSYAMARLQIFNSHKPSDQRLATCAGENPFRVMLKGRDMFLLPTSKTLNLKIQTEYARKISDYSMDHARASLTPADDIKNEIINAPDNTLMILQRYLDGLLHHTAAYVGHKEKYKRTPNIHGTLCTLTSVIDTLATLSGGIHNALKDPTDNPYITAVNRQDADIYTPQKGPETPEQMLWCMNAYEHLSGAYNPKTSSAVGEVETLCYRRLKHYIEGMIADIGHVPAIREWSFNPRDNETAKLLKSHQISIKEVIGYMRNFHAAYHDKLPPERALELGAYIEEFFDAYHAGDIEHKRSAYKFNFYNESFIEHHQALKNFAWRAYDRPGIETVIDRMQERAVNDDEKATAKKIRQLAINPPAGMMTDIRLHIPHDPDIVAARRRQFERGSRSLQIPEMRKTFIRAVATEHRDEIVSYLTRAGMDNPDACVTRMVEQGKLPVDGKGRSILSVDHRNDLDSGGLNLVENFVLVAHKINSQKNDLKSMQDALMHGDQNPHFFLTWVPADPRTKIIL